MPNSTSRPVLAAHALCLALLCSLPHWVSLAKNHGDYLPFSVSPAVSALTFDETHAYAPPARRFLQTGRIQAESDNFENRNLSAGIPFVPAAILGAMAKALGGLSPAFIAADCLFPALLFLLYYSMSSQAVPAFSWRLLIAWASVLVPFGLQNTFWLGVDPLLAPLEITRTPQPEISFLLLLAAAALLAKALRPAAPVAFVIAAGVASGVVVYCYYYYAVAWGITLGLIWLTGVARLRTTIVTALMITCAIPFVLATLKGNAQGGQTNLLARMGEFTHRPDWLPLCAAVALSLALLFTGKRFFAAYPAYFVLAALIVAALYGMNFQILSGFETQPWHFWKRLALPIAFFLAAIFAARRSQSKWAAYALLLLLIASTSARLTVAALRTAPEQKASRPAFQLLNWARTHLPADRVIGATDPELILLIPGLTTDYTYVPSGLRSLTPTTEIVKRYDELACFVGLSPSAVAQAAAVPNHLAHSTELMQVLGLTYTGDPSIERAFNQQYASAWQHCAPPHARLDYLVLPADHKQNDLSKAVLYRNSSYQLLPFKATP